MKRKVLVSVMALLIISTVIMTACGKKADPLLEKYAGVYSFYSLYLYDTHVISEEFEGTTTTLEANGKGSLNWGEDNKGPISEWTAKEDGSIVIKAGVSTINGKVEDGVMFLELTEDLVTCYVTEDADTSQMPRVTVDELVGVLGE